MSESDMDKLAKVVASSYERASSYSRVILGLGYVALLTIWSGTRQLMTERLAVIAALLIVVSILAYPGRDCIYADAPGPKNGSPVFDQSL